MTHIGAFTVNKESGEKYVFAIAESQASNKDRGIKSDNAQKLFKLNDNFVMATGRESSILEILENVPKDDMGPSELSESILEIGKNIKSEYKPRFIITGNSNTPEIWHVDTLGKLFGEPAAKKKNNPTFDGSGILHTGPMIKRDYELGLGEVPDLSEGLIKAYDIGRKAHESLGCSDKLQIGLLGNGSIRTLYHPDVKLKNNRWDYIETNFNIETDTVNNNKIKGMNSILDEFYHGAQIHCRNLMRIDYDATRIFQYIKSDIENRDGHYKNLNQKLEDRDEEKLRITDLIDTWIDGDLKQAIQYLDRFDDYKKNKRKLAIDY